MKVIQLNQSLCSSLWHQAMPMISKSWMQLESDLWECCTYEEAHDVNECGSVHLCTQHR